MLRVRPGRGALVDLGRGYKGSLTEGELSYGPLDGVESVLRPGDPIKVGHQQGQGRLAGWEAWGSVAPWMHSFPLGYLGSSRDVCVVVARVCCRSWVLGAWTGWGFNATQVGSRVRGSVCTTHTDSPTVRGAGQSARSVQTRDVVHFPIMEWTDIPAG